MSVTKKPGSLPISDVKKVAETNPQVDVEQLKEARALLGELRKGGRRQREYGITSPYARKPLQKGRSSGFGTPHG